MKPIAITGMGPVGPIGIGYDAWCVALDAYVDGDEYAFRGELTTLSEAIPNPVAAEVRGFDATVYLGKKGLRSFDRLTKLLLVASKLALEDAGLKRDGEHVVYGADRIGVCSATAYGSLDAITELVRVAELEDPRYLNPSRFPNTVINSSAGYVGIWQELRAPNVTVVDGNCGSLDAVLTSETQLQTGRADAIVVGGGEVLSEPLYLAFRKLDALAEGERPYRPGQPDSGGMRLGEGASYAILERLEAAQERGARVRGMVRGYGNAFEPPESEAILVHPSQPAVERAMRMALRDADMAAADVDLVCGSLGGLPPFDRAELDGIEAVFGTQVPVAAPKAVYGETFGAGGALGMACAMGWLDGARVRPLVRGSLQGPPNVVLISSVGYYGNVSAVVVTR